METDIERLLDHLADACSTVALRPGDWQTLYVVCLYSHVHGGVPDLQTIKAYLIGKGCSKKKAGFIGRQFEHLTKMLKLHDDYIRRVSAS